MPEAELRWQLNHALMNWVNLFDRLPMIVLPLEQELHRRGLMVSVRSDFDDRYNGSPVIKHSDEDEEDEEA